jgi:heme oxygenase (biliverdin-IX-beta and delta-forming)
MPEIAVPTPSDIARSRFVAPIPTIRNILKQATADDHAALDARLTGFDMNSFDGYRRFLEANAAAQLPLEAALVAAGVKLWLSDWEQRARSRAILSDLAAMGGTARPLDPPALVDRSAMLGTLYVLEGSRLGAAYLVRSVAASTDPRISGATAYLSHGQGQHLFASFLTVLESHGGDLDGEAGIVIAARNAFGMFAKAAETA